MINWNKTIVCTRKLTNTHSCLQALNRVNMSSIVAKFVARRINFCEKATCTFIKVCFLKVVIIKNIKTVINHKAMSALMKFRPINCALHGTEYTLCKRRNTYKLDLLSNGTLPPSRSFYQKLSFSSHTSLSLQLFAITSYIKSFRTFCGSRHWGLYICNASMKNAANVEECEDSI